MSTTWRWEVEDFVANTSKRQTGSAPFYHDGHKVVLSAVKKETDRGDQLSLWVRLPDCATLPATIGIDLVTRITLVHRRDRKLDISRSDNESAPSFYSPSSTSLGWGGFIRIDEVSEPDSGFVSEGGAILVDVQLLPIKTVKWELPNFANLSGKQQSPTFTIAEIEWRVELDPKGRGSGANTHVSAYLHNLATESWGNHSRQAKWSLACLDGNKRRQHEHTSSDIFSATRDNFGIDQWIDLGAVTAPSAILPNGVLQVVANVQFESVRWQIEGVTLSKLQRAEGPTFSLGGVKWKPVAGSTIGGTTGDKAVIALCQRYVRASNRDFSIRPDLSINLCAGGATLAADVDANDRFVEKVGVFWGARVLPPPDAAAEPVNFEAAFTLPTKPTSVSWVIKDFRSFLDGAICPPSVKSGKIIVGGRKVELIVYPHGNGGGQHSHISCFISVTPTVGSGVSEKMKFSFEAHNKHGKTHCVAIEEVVVDEQPVGVARFLRLNDVEDFLGADGGFRVDVSWGDASSTQPPIPPCREESDVDLLKHVLTAEKKWRDVRGCRDVSSLLGELDSAAQIATSALCAPDAWEIPTRVADAIEACADAWAALTLKQNEVRKLVAGGGDPSETCSQRDKARRSFCKSVENMNVIDDMNALRELQAKEFLTLTDLETRFPKKTNAEISDTGTEEAKNALYRLAKWKEEWEEKLKITGNATDNAARDMRGTLGCLFDADSTRQFDEKYSQTSYRNFLVQLYEEERARAECKATFPTEIVVRAYYATKENAMLTKKRAEELWEHKERAIACKNEVEKWLVKAPDSECLKQREVERKRLEIKKKKLEVEYLELDLEANLETPKKHKRKNNKMVATRPWLQAEQLAAELEEDGPKRVAKAKSIDNGMLSVVDALRKVDKARLKDLADLWKIQQDHFPELTLLSEPSVTEIAPFLSEHRQLDMYSGRKCLHAGRHQIWEANFLGEPCALKQFPNDAEMLREAKVQLRLRHRAVVPLQAVFRESGASYIQLPLYKCDLAAWLCANSVGVDTLKNMVSSILHVVAHIHQCGLVHGDLKPRNFLVDDESRLVLCDFGSSRKTVDATATLLTLTCVCGGTQGYIAPELTQDGSKPSKATDMYSVGCIILTDLLPRCSADSSDLKDLRRLAETFRSQDPKQRPTAMAALAEVTHRPLSDFPAYWKTKSGVMSRLYDNTSYMEAQALRLLRDSTTHTGDGICALKRLKEAVVTKVERNENPVLFRNYMRKKAEIAEYHKKSDNTMAPIGLPLGEDKEWLIDPTVNECYLLHGTPVANVPKILEDGLNERVANFGGLYGVGSYFASESCKAMQYCRQPMLLHDPVEPGQEYCMLMCRVLVGDAYNTDKVFKSSSNAQDYLREPPARQDKKRWDSIIAAPGKKTTRDGKQAREQTHYETIIFDRAQIYPEFAIYFKVP